MSEMKEAEKGDKPPEISLLGSYLIRQDKNLAVVQLVSEVGKGHWMAKDESSGATFAIHEREVIRSVDPTRCSCVGPKSKRNCSIHGDQTTLLNCYEKYLPTDEKT